MSAADAEDDYGAYHDDLQKIRLSPSFPTTQMEAETLVHEMLHGAWEVAGLHDGDSEEKVVTALSKQLCSIIQANPQLIAWLQDSLKTEGT
jgi:hypothetical protein